MLRAMVLLTAIGFLHVSSAIAEEEKSVGKDSLTGTWKLTSVAINAQSLSMEKLQEARLVVQGPKYSLVLGDIRLEMTHALQADKQPKAMDLTVAEGPEKGKVFRAIYKLDGGKLTVCRNIKPDLERPAEFASKPDTGLMLVVWQRLVSE